MRSKQTWDLQSAIWGYVVMSAYKSTQYNLLVMKIRDKQKINRCFLYTHYWLCYEKRAKTRELKRVPDGYFVNEYLLFLNWCGCVSELLLIVNIKLWQRNEIQMNTNCKVIKYVYLKGEKSLLPNV